MKNSIIRVALGTVLILMIPFIAMQFTTEVDWKLTDFAIIGALLFGAGTIFVMVTRVAPRKYRGLIGIAFLLAVLLTWVHLAVGIVDSWPFAGS